MAEDAAPDILVKAPNGGMIPFPAGTSQADINTDMKRRYDAGEFAASAGVGQEPTAPKDDVEGAAPAKTQMRASLPQDSNLQVKRFAAARFPDMPIEDAMKRYGIIDGNIVYADEKGILHRETPSVGGGKGFFDTIKRGGLNVANDVGPAAPQVAAMGAGIATGPTPLSPLAAGGAAISVDQIRGLLDKHLAGEDRTPSWDDLLNSLGHGAEAATGQGVAAGISKLATRNPLAVGYADKIKALSPERQAAAKTAETEAKDLGVNLRADQATDLRSMKVKARQLAKDEDTSDMMAEAQEAQTRTQVPRAMRNFADSVSPDAGSEATAKLRTGAQDVYDATRKAGSEAAAPLYDQAFAANKNVDSPVLQTLYKSPTMRKAMAKASQNIQDELSQPGANDPELLKQAKEAILQGNMDEAGVPKVGIANGLKLRYWDYVKKALGEMEEAASEPGGKEFSTADAKRFGNLRRSLTSELDNLDTTAAAGPNSTKPEGGLYAQARRAAGDGFDAVDAIEKGGIKFIRSLKGDDSSALLDRVFSTKSLSPNTIAKARLAYANAGKIDDWNAGVAGWLHNRIDDALSPEVANPAQKFFRQVGENRQRERLTAALGGHDQLGAPTGSAAADRVADFDKLMRVLNNARKTLPEGSSTSTDTPGIAAKLGNLGSTVAKLTSAKTYVNPGEAVKDAIERLQSSPEAKRKLAESYLAGDFDKQLKQLRLLGPKSDKALAIGSQIANAALVGVAKPPKDDVEVGDVETPE